MALAGVLSAATGALSTGAGNWDMGSMLAGLGTSGRSTKVDQKFTCMFAKVDYKAQRQEMHRDDLRDLMELTVGRMDMYNLVAALLVTFAFDWVCDNTVIQKGPRWPRWFATVFVINCFCAMAFLTMSLWFAMSCAVSSKTVGTRLLVNFARLSLPRNDEIKKMRVKYYDPGKDIAEMTQIPFLHRGQEGGSSSSRQRGPAGPSGLGDIISEDSKEDCASLEDVADLPEDEIKNDSNVDFERHFRAWLRGRGQWLFYDGYARACMVVGMNQLLQAMCYNLIAAVWDVSHLTAWVFLMLSKLLSYLILWIDRSGMMKGGDRLAFLFFEFSPPALAMATLCWFPPGPEGTVYVQKECVLVLPIFCAHAGWMMYLCFILRDHPGQSVSPHGADSDSSGDDSHSTPIKSLSSVEKAGIMLLPSTLRALQHMQVIHLQQTCVALGEERIIFDRTPAKAVKTFTLAVAVTWIVAGLLHSSRQWFDIEPKELGARPAEGHARRLGDGGPWLRPVAVRWPEPASLFEVQSLHCSGAQLLVESAFTTYGVQWPGGAETGELADLGRIGAAAVLCSSGSCDVLFRQGENGSAWGLAPLESCLGSSVAEAVEPVQLPSSWRLVAASWEGCRARPCTSAWVAGWDGASIAVGTLRRRGTHSAARWAVEVRFRVRPGAGLCEAGEEVCKQRARNGSYEEVRALQLGPEGRSLAVLLGDGTLDAWRLEVGALVARWSLGAEYVAMCYNGEVMHFARQEPGGPVLERAALPAPLLAERPAALGPEEGAGRGGGPAEERGGPAAEGGAARGGGAGASGRPRALRR